MAGTQIDTKTRFLPWYPGHILHQMNTTKQIFKKSNILNNFNEFLQKEFYSGLVAKQ